MFYTEKKRIFRLWFTQHSIFAKRKLSVGFTLIEVLVVIAIISVLASVVLASLSIIRDKGINSAIKENLITIRAQTELYYTGNDNYGDDIAGGCSVANTIFVDDTVVASAIAAILKINGGNALTCMADDGLPGLGATASSWAVSSPLHGGGSWCVDSFGSSFIATAQISSNVASCQ
jgi:prepilin-type N-terminal cleavage/methylation domain-containing protein